jgi:hypothetical protein
MWFMNTPQAHLDKARRSRQFLQSLTVTDDNADWAIVVLHYRALHLVRAFIHHSGSNPYGSHRQTIDEVQRLFPRTLSMSYLRLDSRSRLYRYDLLGALADEYVQLEANDFAPVLAHVQTELPGAI